MASSVSPALSPDRIETCTVVSTDRPPSWGVPTISDSSLSTMLPPFSRRPGV
ncbi:hypothetical protein D3C74_443360 [compost metagenome]